MLFSSDEEDFFDLEELFKDVDLDDSNQYINDSDNAIQLLASLIRNEAVHEQKAINSINRNIRQLFTLLSSVTLDHKLEIYQQFKTLTTRLAERKKIQHISDKVVISFGGKFSAGKSNFINSIAKIDGLLPVAQSPTTSIATYIIAAKEDKITANSIYGYTTPLTTEAMAALTHEFYDTYQVGFSAFVDSIIVESAAFSLSDRIALLDTPGYTKADRNSRAKNVRHRPRKGEPSD